MVEIVKLGQTSEKIVKILKIHGLVWFVWFDLGLRALNFKTVSHSVNIVTKVGIELLGQLKMYNHINKY